MMKASCEIPEIPEVKEQPSNGMDQVPQEKIDRMIAYAKMLRKKFPHMKPERIKRKVAEYFKVKLV